MGDGARVSGGSASVVPGMPTWVGVPANTVLRREALAFALQLCGPGAECLEVLGDARRLLAFLEGREEAAVAEVVGTAQPDSAGSPWEVRSPIIDKTYVFSSKSNALLWAEAMGGTDRTRIRKDLLVLKPGWTITEMKVGRE